VPIGCQLIIESQGLVMSASQAKYPYKEAVLADRKGDISKPWYVNYYVWSEIEGKLVRKRSKLSHPSKKERYEQAKKQNATF